MASLRTYQTLLRKLFEERLSGKTGWGRIEVMQQFDQAAAEAALEYADNPKEANDAPAR